MGEVVCIPFEGFTMGGYGTGSMEAVLFVHASSPTCIYRKLPASRRGHIITCDYRYSPTMSSPQTFELYLILPIQGSVTSWYRPAFPRFFARISPNPGKVVLCHTSRLYGEDVSSIASP